MGSSSAAGVLSVSKRSGERLELTSFAGRRRHGNGSLTAKEICGAPHPLADGTAHKNRMQGNDFVQSLMYADAVMRIDSEAEQAAQAERQYWLQALERGPSPRGERMASVYAKYTRGLRRRLGTGHR
jgi:hypothetical protein